jgi:archaeosine synthase
MRKYMLSLTFMDGYRTGVFSWKENQAHIPGLLKVRGDVLMWGDITIERPTLYQKSTESDIKTLSLLRIPYAAPKSIATTFIQANSSFLSQEGDACPLFVTRYGSLHEKFLSVLPFFHLFFVFCREERRLLSTVFHLRNKIPCALIFTEASPEEIPLLLYAGVDLFNHTPKNEKALEQFLSSPTKEYLEKECNSSVRAKKLLKLLYRENYEKIEKYTAYKRKKALYISSDSLFRPEVVRFRQYIRERYIPPSRIFILLPCSARKPYSLSRSHQHFRKNIPRTAHITELILTSPLGVVPRELEEYVSYDIPVTGHWSHEEIQEAASLLKDIISKVENPVIFSHLPDEYRSIPELLPFEINNTVEDHPLSSQSMKNLSSVVSTAEKAPEPFQVRKMRAISRFLFTEDIFPDAIRVIGRRVKRVIGDDVLATYSKDMTLTQAGAERVNTYVVDIDFDLKGDVFCPGVLHAHSHIRPGEQVVIKRNHAVGIGKAVVSGFLMTRLEKGIAVKVKKRFSHAGESNH